MKDNILKWFKEMPFKIEDMIEHGYHGMNPNKYKHFFYHTKTNKYKSRFTLNKPYDSTIIEYITELVEGSNILIWSTSYNDIHYILHNDSIWEFDNFEDSRRKIDKQYTKLGRLQKLKRLKK